MPCNRERCCKKTGFFYSTYKLCFIFKGYQQQKFRGAGVIFIMFKTIGDTGKSG